MGPHLIYTLTDQSYLQKRPHLIYKGSRGRTHLIYKGNDAGTYVYVWPSLVYMNQMITHCELPA